MPSPHRPTTLSPQRLVGAAPWRIVGHLTERHGRCEARARGGQVRGAGDARREAAVAASAGGETLFGRERARGARLGRGGERLEARAQRRFAAHARPAVRECGSATRQAFLPTLPPSLRRDYRRQQADGARRPMHVTAHPKATASSRRSGAQQKVREIVCAALADAALGDLVTLPSQRAFQQM